MARRIRDFAPYLNAQGAEVDFAGVVDEVSMYDGIRSTYWCPELADGNASNEGYILRDIVSQADIDIIHVHEVKNTAAYASLVGTVPLAVHLQNYRMWCPAQDWFYARQEKPCKLTLGWKCIPNAYTKQCNNRHPERLLRSLMECGKRRALIDEGVHFIAGSRYMADVAETYGSIPRKQLRVVPNAIDGNRFRQPSQPPDGFDDLESGFVLYAGRFSKSKGIGYLLEAYDRLEPRRPPLVLAGGGHYRASIEQKISELHLGDQVILVGWQSAGELAWLYKNARMVVVPSIWEEVFGNVGLEAMAAGTPAIAFDVGGISEWLVDGETGYLVPEGYGALRNRNAVSDR